MVRRTHEEAQQTRHDILDAAERVFHAHGVAAATLQQIAAEAGVTRGAVYHHFGDKQEIVEAMLARVIQPLGADMAATLGSAGAPRPLERIAAHIGKLFAYVAHTAQAQRVFDILSTRFEYGAVHEPMRQRQQASRREFIAQVGAALAQAQRAGEIVRAPAAAELAIGLVALVDGLIRAWILDPASFDLEGVGGAAVRRSLEGLRQR